MAFASTLSRFSRLLLTETASLGTQEASLASRPLCSFCMTRAYSARPAAVEGRRRPVTVRSIRKKHKSAERISMVTAYDYNQAVLTDKSKVDMILVGDSVGMVALGHETTVPVTVDDILHHTKAVKRGAGRALVVADMPFGSYEVGAQDALRNALRLIKDGGAAAVKVEGGSEIAPTVSALTGAGIAVVGHIGLQPQRVNVSGYAYVGQTAAQVEQLLNDAKALQEAGCFALVLECVPEEVAAIVTERCSIPTIGIGAGKHTSGQVLVWHDMFGMFDSRPSFAKLYANLGETIRQQLDRFHDEVACGAFPDASHSRKLKKPSILASFGGTREGDSGLARQPATLSSSPDVQRVLVLGSGAMAMRVACGIAQGAGTCDSGTKVAMLDPWYSEHTAAATRNGGLQYIGAHGDTQTVPVMACSNVAELHEKMGRADLVIVLTKSYQLQLEPERVNFEELIEKDGIVLSLQNGAGNKDLLQKLCKNMVLLGTTSHGAKIVGEGCVQHTGEGPSFIVAQTEDEKAAAAKMAEVLELAGLPSSVTDQEEVILEKVIINAAINPISALLNVTNGKLLECPSLIDGVIRCVVSEGVRVLPNLVPGGSQDQKIQELVQKVRQVAMNTANNNSSMLSDLKRGPNTEIDSINGFLAEENRLNGFDAPVNSLLTALVKAKAQQHIN